ncbi:hypothetical protein AB1N83_008937 [Pleurotus pulmonarius]
MSRKLLLLYGSTRARTPGPLYNVKASTGTIHECPRGTRRFTRYAQSGEIKLDLYRTIASSPSLNAHVAHIVTRGVRLARRPQVTLLNPEVTSNMHPFLHSAFLASPLVMN